MTNGKKQAIKKGMTHFEIRKKFIHFFKREGHKIELSSSLIPEGDPSLLFVNAGMNPFKNVFLGLEPPPAKNIATIQRCLRAGGKHNDLEQVGETPRHHTFFEMMGNFSFGGYFKKEAIGYAWDFLTKELGLSPENLWATVHKKDAESYEIWSEIIPKNKIYRLGDKENFWQMGASGPSGYCSEIHYYKGEEKRPKPSELLEVWNLVFMEFYDTKEGERKKLPQPSVDTGMGLERISSILQNKKSNYHSDLFVELLWALEKASPFKYDFEEKTQAQIQKAFRVVADHSRAVAFLVADGVWPGADGAEYVLRRIIRRAFYYSDQLKPKENLLKVGAKEAIRLMSFPLESQDMTSDEFKELGLHPELKREEREIETVIEEEAERFSHTLREGKLELEKRMNRISGRSLPKEMIWDLFSSYGLPMDLTCLMMKERGFSPPTEKEMEEYKKTIGKKLAQGLSTIQWEDFKKEALKAISLKNRSLLGTKFTGYEKDEGWGEILSVLSIKAPPSHSHPDSPVSTLGSGRGPEWDFSLISKGSKGYVILDKTCFYPEGGGPVGDKGFLWEDPSFSKHRESIGHPSDKSKPQDESLKIAQVLDCQKIGKSLLHEVKALKDLRPGQKCYAKVDKNFRKGIKASHTATHLLNSALRKLLRDSIRQAGSLVKPYYLRFDFTYPGPLSKKQIQQVEERVGQSILSKEDLSTSHKNFEQAKKEGFLYLKGENYDPEVRVVSIGENSSKELCGGIHVQNTKEISAFKIVGEKGVQAGVRRIIAYTGKLAKAWEKFLIHQNEELRRHLKIPSLHFEKKEAFWEGSMEGQNPFLKWMEDREKELKLLRKKIVRLGEEEYKPSPLGPPESGRKFQSLFHPLAQQILELREHLKLSPPDPKEDLLESDKNFREFFLKEPNSPLDLIKGKEREVKNFTSVLKKIKNLELKKEEWEGQAQTFSVGGLTGRLLTLTLPVEDRKILADISDFLLASISPGILILLGEGEEKSPVLVNVTKDLSKILSAGDILKNKIAPLCKGRGGGKAGFAGGSISERSAFSQVEKILLQEIASKTSS